MKHSSENLYKDYWVGVAEERKKRSYYERLYHHLKEKIHINNEWRILDVAGGNGHLSRYLNIKESEILDISDSGLEEAKKFGYRGIKGNVQKRFPVDENAYDAALCFEVLEHLYFPNKTLAEINNILKPKGILYIGQPNMRADGTFHVRRYTLTELLTDLKKTGFTVDWIDYVPAYTMRDSIISDIKKNPSWIRKTIQCVNLILSFLPWKVRYCMAKIIPDRFALIFVIKAFASSK